MRTGVDNRVKNDTTDVDTKQVAANTKVVVFLGTALPHTTWPRTSLHGQKHRRNGAVSERSCVSLGVSVNPRASTCWLVPRLHKTPENVPADMGDLAMITGTWCI